jgi:uncharacterized protein (DUF305 family)
MVAGLVQADPSMPITVAAEFDLCAAPSDAAPTFQAESSESSESPAAAAPNDLLLIDEMLANHAGAMTMANVALQRANDSRVRRIALRIAESHAGEIQLLRHWRDTRFPGAEPTFYLSAEQQDRPAPSPGDDRALAELCAARDNFDQIFLERMIDHHRSAIELAEHARKSAEHQEIVEFAIAIIAARTSEVAMMNQWLAEMGATPTAST